MQHEIVPAAQPTAMQEVQEKDLEEESHDLKGQTPDVEESALPTLGKSPSTAGDQKLSANPFSGKADYPPLDWSSKSAFSSSLQTRLRLIFTKRFLLCVLAGQFLAVCITSTNVCSTELANRNWIAPTFQSTLVYITLNFMYTSYTLYSYGFMAWLKMIKTSGWKYLILAAIDVEANFMAVKAYQYTDILSAQLLNCWATPVCIIGAYFLMKSRYHWSQVLGVLICIGGLVLTVVGDYELNGIYGGNQKIKGNFLALAAATCYGMSNVLEEFFVRNRPMYEVVGQLAFWGTIISVCQAAGLEHNNIASATWNGATVGILIAYTVSLVSLYTIAPLLFRATSSPFYNLSLLTGNFWGLCFGLGLSRPRLLDLWFSFPNGHCRTDHLLFLPVTGF